MVRVLFSLALLGVMAPALSQLNDYADNRTILGGGNDLLSAGAYSIRAGFYDDGIRLTERGLARGDVSEPNRAAALSNLCAAFAAKHELDLAIQRCTESIKIDERNWRAYSNRSYAFYLKGQYRRATRDLQTAQSINPAAREVAQIRGMINERNLRPSVIVEEHQ